MLLGHGAYDLVTESPFNLGVLGTIYGIFVLIHSDPPPMDPLSTALAILSELIPAAQPLSFSWEERVEIHALHLGKGNLRTEGFSATVPSLAPDHLIPAAMAFLSYHLVSDLRRELEEEFRDLPQLTKDLLGGGGEGVRVRGLERLNSFTASYPILISLLRRLMRGRW